MWVVYILLCDGRKFYIGLTDNLDRRVGQHQKKQSFYTKQFSTIEPVYKEEFETRKSAELRERQIKGWSVAKKKALIAGEKELLIRLSKGIGVGEASSGFG